MTVNATGDEFACRRISGVQCTVGKMWRAVVHIWLQSGGRSMFGGEVKLFRHCRFLPVDSAFFRVCYANAQRSWLAHLSLSVSSYLPPNRLSNTSVSITRIIRLIPSFLLPPLRILATTIAQTLLAGPIPRIRSHSSSDIVRHIHRPARSATRAITRTY